MPLSSGFNKSPIPARAAYGALMSEALTGYFARVSRMSVSAWMFFMR